MALKGVVEALRRASERWRSKPGLKLDPQLARDPAERPARPYWREFLEVALVAIVLAMFVRTFSLQAFRVSSDSMEPGLLVGDLVLVNKFMYGNKVQDGAQQVRLLPSRPVQRGDVVVFRRPTTPHQILVKRCVGLPSDELTFVDKQLRLNGEWLSEPYVLHQDPHTYPHSEFVDPPLRQRDNLGPLQVPNGRLFCLGDNRDQSLDSRAWGAISRQSVIGRATLVAWSRVPTSRARRGSHFDRSRAARIISAPTRFLRSFRLDRTLRQIR